MLRKRPTWCSCRGAADVLSETIHLYRGGRGSSGWQAPRPFTVRSPWVSARSLLRPYQHRNRSPCRLPVRAHPRAVEVVNCRRRVQNRQCTRPRQLDWDKVGFALKHLRTRSRRNFGIDQLLRVHLRHWWSFRGLSCLFPMTLNPLKFESLTCDRFKALKT